MPGPAAVAGDIIQGTCPKHIESKAGAPVKAPPLPFSAPVTQALSTTVLIMGKPAAVVGSFCVNTPAHTGLHSSDPHQYGPKQIGTVTVGSATVMIEGRGAAMMGSVCAICFNLPLGKMVGTGVTVLIGA